MESEKLAAEVDSLRKVLELLAPLEDEAKARVLNYSMQALGVQGLRQLPPGLPKVTRGPGAVSTAAGTDKPTSPQEYLRAHNHKVMTKRIAVVAVFLERVRSKRRFALKDITEAFREAKEAKIPAHSQFGRAQAMGYITKDSEGFYATNKAETLVDQGEVADSAEPEQE